MRKSSGIVFKVNANQKSVECDFFLKKNTVTVMYNVQVTRFEVCFK